MGNIIMKIIVTILLLNVASTRGKFSQYNTISIVDDAHLFPATGVYLEPAGQYISYSGAIHIPFVYVLPQLNIIDSTNCSGKKTLVRLHNQVINHIKQSIDLPHRNPDVRVYKSSPLESTHRTKRSFLPIVSLLTGGLSVWNTVELQTLKMKVKIFDSNIGIIDKEIEDIDKSYNMVIKDLGQVTMMLGDHTKALSQLINKTRCEEELLDDTLQYLAGWLQLVPFEFLSAYNSAITGVLSPSIISAHNLYKVLLNHNDMINTLYTLEPSSVYELGSVVMTDVHISDKAYFRGFIQLPKLINMKPLPLYTVHVVNVIQNNVDTQYNLPNKLVCPTLKSCWSPSRDNCIMKTSRLICLYGAMQEQCTCINNMQLNMTLGCAKSIRRPSDPLVVQTKSGILIGGSLESYKTYRRNGDIDILSDVVKPRNEATLVTSQMGDWVHINDNVYSTKITGYDYNYTVYNITAPLTDLDIDITRMDHWVPLQEIPHVPLITGDTTDYAFTFLIITSILHSFIITFILWRLYHKAKSNKKFASLDHSSHKGLR